MIRLLRGALSVSLLSILPTALVAQGGRATILGVERGDFEAPALELVTDQRARVDIRLQIGEITQQVQVTADAALVQTDDNTLSTVIDAAKIRELPLPANRNVFRLALLAPGMSRGPASSVTTSGFGAGFGIASMGQKVHNNAVQLDGAPLKTSMHGVIRMRPSVEAIEEFRVESGWYSAGYGTQSGAQIIAAMRAGTNQFHGVLFEFLRNDKLDTRNVQCGWPELMSGGRYVEWPRRTVGRFGNHVRFSVSVYSNNHDVDKILEVLS